MPNQKISLTVYYFDEQFDVEVYKWIDALDAKGDILENLSEYGFDSKKEVDIYIDSLDQNFNIVEINITNDEEEEFEEEEIEPMTRNEFWFLIDESLKQKNLDSQRKWIWNILSQMTDVKIDSFDEHMREIHDDIFNHENFIEGARLAGVWGDDALVYFGGWLISRGKKVMMEILKNPFIIDKYMNTSSLERYGGARNESFLYSESYAKRLKEERNVRL